MQAEVGYTNQKNATRLLLNYPIVDLDSKNYDNKVCAILRQEDNSLKYLIKYYAGFFYNPNDTIANRTYRFSWKQVKPEVFQLYIEFLRTGLERYLRQAERKI